ncbi:MAG: sensor histidine kinase [Dermatophilaceae bacterium]
MTLRRRLVVAVAGIAAVLLVAGVVVVLVQRAFLVDRLDAQLEQLAQSPRAVLAASQRAGAENPDAGLADVWVGRMTPDGRVVEVLTPASDPQFAPQLRPGESIPTPQVRLATGGGSRLARVVTADLPNARGKAVLAIPTTSADVATRRLALTLGVTGVVVVLLLALAARWVDRLVLRPVAEMTEAADGITAGDLTRRVPAGPPGTEAARLGRALNTMIDVTTASQERMRRFVADASHELRTPLTTLQGYAALHAAAQPGAPADDARAASGPGDARAASGPVVADAMRRIGEEAARMGRLVDTLLDLTGLEDPARLGREPVDLAPLLHDVVTDLRVVAPDREVELDVPSSLVVPGDRDRIVQAMVGLTSNAVRHTPAGTPVTVRAGPTEEGVRIEVADAGPGIPAEHLPHLFDRFYRVDPARSSVRGGSGLGLAIVDAIARAHGGSVAVWSAEGRGTVFRLDLPR